jgi:hypothetical protein
METAPPERKSLSTKKIVAIIILVIVAFSSILLLQAQFPTVTPRSIVISGSATAGSYGNATAVEFVLQSNLKGYTGPAPFFSFVVNGRYNVTVPNHATYAVGIDFQPPNGRPSGTCSTADIKVNQPPGNSSLTYNWSCFPPYQLPNG